jgi:acetoin utilization protein AcuB
MTDTNLGNSPNNLSYKRYLELPVDEFTSFEPVVVDESASFDAILDIFERHKIRHLPVVRGKVPVGIISERDVRPFRLLDASEFLSAHELMVADPMCITIGTPIQEVALPMSEQKIGSVLVVNYQQELMGIFTSVDGLNALIEILRGDVD